MPSKKRRQPDHCLAKCSRRRIELHDEESLLLQLLQVHLWKEDKELVAVQKEEEGERVVLLPEEVEESVLARLPIREVFRLRCVCKSWNRILRSPHFFALHSQSGAPSETWLVMQSVQDKREEEEIFMFDTATRRWLQPPLPRLSGLSSHYYGAATAGGLVCVPATEKKATHYFVVNIFTASVKKLPPAPFQSVCLLYMSSSDSVKYRVFLVHRPSCRVAMYDSSTQVWKVGKSHSQVRFSADCYVKVTMVHGELFARVYRKRPPHYQWVFVYDIHQEKWTNLALPWPHCQLGIWASHAASGLLGCGNGRTVLSVPDLSPDDTCHGFRVWDLQKQEPKNNHQSGRKWVEMARTPTAAQCATPKAESLQLHILFSSSHDFILMTGANLKATHYLKPALYDVSQDRWDSLPPLPPYIASHTQGYVSLMMLEPNLAATP